MTNIGNKVVIDMNAGKYVSNNIVLLNNSHNDEMDFITG